MTKVSEVGLQYLVQFRNGQDYKQVEDETGDVPVYGSGGQFGWASASLYEGESVLFGRKGTIDRPLYVNGKLWTVDTMFYTELGDQVDGRWLHYWATTIPFGVYSTATALPSMTSSVLGRIKAPVLSLESQRAIADYLDRETGEIDEMVAKLDELAETLEARWEAKSAAYLLPFGVPGDPTALESVLALGYKRVLPMNALVQQRKEKNHDESAQYLSLMKGVGVIRYEDKGDVGNKKPTDLTRCIRVRTGDYVLNSMNFYIGSYGISPLDGVCSSVYLICTPRKSVIEPNFLKHLFANTELRQRIQDLGNGILEHRKSIPWDRFAAVKVPLPELNEQRKIIAVLDASRSEFDAMLAKVAELKSLLIERRAALITDVVTGRKEVA
ncbi:hypothetical protein [Leucobacter chromiireducens]|uniref:restriction endonuclease subunit S n=1 Tax=Leucobacter chromiireducens TaxID=283877 RepID=UPI0019D04572|nr:hypothetical protein [Leucobacter chromiireducens]